MLNIIKRQLYATERSEEVPDGYVADYFSFLKKLHYIAHPNPPLLLNKHFLKNKPANLIFFVRAVPPPRTVTLNIIKRQLYATERSEEVPNGYAAVYSSIYTNYIFFSSKVSNLSL